MYSILYIVPDWHVAGSFILHLRSLSFLFMGTSKSILYIVTTIHDTIMFPRNFATVTGCSIQEYGKDVFHCIMTCTIAMFFIICHILSLLPTGIQIQNSLYMKSGSHPFFLSKEQRQKPLSLSLFLPILSSWAV